MSYSDFNLMDIKTKLSLSLNEKTQLFATVKEVQHSQHLAETLSQTLPLAMAVNTEKARSEWIVSPVLLEVIKQLGDQVSLFSGVEMNVDKNRGLNGICDFIISLSPEQFYLDVPVVTIVETKNDNIYPGLGQCISEMLASQIFNENKEKQIKTIYGVVTTGNLWKFLKLEKQQVWIDKDEYHISNLTKIVGIFNNIIRSIG